jgi:hypothetical protein
MDRCDRSLGGLFFWQAPTKREAPIKKLWWMKTTRAYWDEEDISAVTALQASRNWKRLKAVRSPRVVMFESFIAAERPVVSDQSLS